MTKLRSLALHPLRRTRAGFALIISLSLMTLLLLLVLTLTIFVHLELQTAQGKLNTEEARQNALLGAYIAIGQLQKFAGPDQRITTTVDLFHKNDQNDSTTSPITPSGSGGQAFPYVYAKASGLVDPPTPYGALGAYGYSGVLHWTVVWGTGVTPLSIYTGHDTNGNISPDPVIMNYLVSGDESTPVNFLPNGVVTAPKVINFTPDLNNATVGIYRLSDPSDKNQFTWTSLTNDLIMLSNSTAGLTANQAAIILVGPNSAETNATNPITLFPGNDPAHFSFKIQQFHPVLNMVVVPLVNITVPGDSNSNLTVGRYAFWVGDEGVKAKYNIADPYANADQSRTYSGTGATQQSEIVRDRFEAPQRTGIERLYNMSTYATNVNNPNKYDATAAALLGEVLDESEVPLLDHSLQGISGLTGSPTDGTDPRVTLRVHYHDYTTYSYGVLADALRGGLRYDLTAAFEQPAVNAFSAVFTDPANGLKGKSIIPPAVGTAAALTTEPFATTLGLKNFADGSVFHGPAATDPANAGRNGLKWDILQSYYAIASNNTGVALQTPAPWASTNTLAAVVMQPGNNTQAAISPVILQARLKFSQTVDSAQNHYMAVEPIFVLGNPYNFPITPPTGGMDLGFRMNADNKWEWGATLVARNNDRVAPHNSGVGVYIGYDNTQNPSLAGAGNPNAGNISRAGYGGLFYSSQANTPTTPSSASGFPIQVGTGTGVQPGYFPILKNPVSYTQFISPVPNVGGSPGNSKYVSVLDQVAFHIPQKLGNGQQLVLQPGEAMSFVLADESAVGGWHNIAKENPTYQPNASKYNQMSTTLRKITSVVDGETQAAYYLNTNEVVPVPMMPGTLPAGTHYFMLRFTGVSTDASKLRPYSTSNSTVANWNLTIPGVGGNITDTVSYGNNTKNLWPDASFGYISTAWPAVSAVLELRANPVAVTPKLNSDGSSSNAPISAGSIAEISSGSYISNSHVALPGENILQSVELDLSGAGDNPPSKPALHTYPDPAGYLPPIPGVPKIGAGTTTFYRRQFIGTGTPGTTTVPTTSAGVLPVFLFSYQMAMALPGNMEGLYYAVDQANAGSGVDPGQETFDPAMQVSYRTYQDFNIRAVNMQLPPYAKFNTAMADGVQTNNAPSFITAPPYGRIYSQGPSFAGTDDSVPSSYNLNSDDVAYNTFDVGRIFSFSAAGGANLNFDSPWGNSFASGTLAGGVPGQQFNVQFALPTRFGNNWNAVVINPNNPGQTLPDIPIISLGQLQHADATADDVWVSVGYQPGHAIGNSYFTPFVPRNSSVINHPIQSGALVKRLTGLAGSAATYAPLTAAANVGAYDISYLLNCALWDRYFFSTLGQGGTNIAPANARLKYAAGITPTAAQLGLNGGPANLNGASSVDPVTGRGIAHAYAAARYMLIDGAFNVNSTSFEAWRAVLSAMRDIAISSNYGGSTDAGGVPQNNSTGKYPVAYFPHAIASGNLAQALTTSPGTSMPVANVWQPLKAGPTLNPTPNAGDSSGLDAASYAGFRQLTDADIDYLAMKIVQQVHLRGPFMSLAQFVNRRLTPLTTTPSGDPLSWSGALQTAIDINYYGVGVALANSNSLNNFYQAMIKPTTVGSTAFTSPMSINNTLIPLDSQGGPNLTQTYPEGPTPFTTAVYPQGSADPNSRLVGIPGWLTQADLLEALAPILAVRSDTFVIRTYGEVISPDAPPQNLVMSVAQNPNLILSHSWCEVVVQRVPDYLATDAASVDDPTATAGVNAPNPAIAGTHAGLSSVNAAFGRRFKVVSVRWLNANDI